MNTLRDAPEATLSTLRIKLAEFTDSDLWRALQALVIGERERILKTLADASVAGEQLKFTQGELAQANRDIMLVEHLSRAIAAEQQRRQRAIERT